MERKLQNLFHETMDVMMASGQTDWFTEVVQSWMSYNSTSKDY